MLTSTTGHSHPSLSLPIARTIVLTIILLLRLVRNCDVHTTPARLRWRIAACRMRAATESSRRTATPFSIRLHRDRVVLTGRKRPLRKFREISSENFVIFIPSSICLGFANYFWNFEISEETLDLFEVKKRGKTIQHRQRNRNEEEEIIIIYLVLFQHIVVCRVICTYTLFFTKWLSPEDTYLVCVRHDLKCSSDERSNLRQC